MHVCMYVCIYLCSHHSASGGNANTLGAMNIQIKKQKEQSTKDLRMVSSIFDVMSVVMSVVMCQSCNPPILYSSPSARE